MKEMSLNLKAVATVFSSLTAMRFFVFEQNSHVDLIGLYTKAVHITLVKSNCNRSFSKDKKMPNNVTSPLAWTVLLILILHNLFEAMEKACNLKYLTYHFAML